jgi:hypothetical protein
MHTDEISQQTAEASERNLARKLREQIAEWKTMRAPARTRTAHGVRVERRPLRTPLTGLGSRSARR